MKYFRTKDGKIWSFSNQNNNFLYEGSDTKNGKWLHEIGEVVKEADTIEGLIMPDDLVEYNGIEYSRIEKDMGDYYVGYDMKIIEKSKITALYIAHGKDVEIDVEKWVLAAIREDEKGDLELV